MQVEIGNDHAIEGYRDEGSPEIQYRPVSGQRTTLLVFPSGIGLQEAFTTTLAALNEHMAATDVDNKAVKPAWIKSDSPGLLTLLQEHYDMARNVRPRTWGNNVKEI